MLRTASLCSLLAAAGAVTVGPHLLSGFQDPVVQAAVRQAAVDQAAVDQAMHVANGIQSSSCFDAATTFLTPDGPKRADAVRVGDTVRVADEQGRLVWDRVAASLSHGNTIADFVRINTTAGQSLRLTPDHYLHVATRPEAACCRAETLLLASHVRAGDEVWAADGGLSDASPLAPVEVASVERVTLPGAYNVVLRQEGARGHFRSIVADGVVASGFTTGFRLIETFGFDAADSLLDPLRELAAAKALEWNARDVNGVAYDGDGDSYMSDMFRTARAMSDLVADCVEGHMAGCSEPELAARSALIVSRARARLGPEAMEVGSRAVEAQLAEHLGLLGRPLAALGRASASEDEFLASAIAHRALQDAQKLCRSDDKCAADMPPDYVSLPAWAVPLLVLAGGVGFLLPVLLVLVARWLCLLARRKKAEAATEETAAAPKAGKADERV